MNTLTAKIPKLLLGLLILAISSAVSAAWIAGWPSDWIGEGLLAAIGLGTLLAIIRLMRLHYQSLQQELKQLGHRMTGFEASLEKRTAEQGTALSSIRAKERDAYRRLLNIEKRLNGMARENREASYGLASAMLYRERPIVTAAMPLVLISQIQRSGGTLLSQLLDGHSQVLAFPHELKWGGTEKGAWPQIDLSQGPMKIAFSLIEKNLKDLNAFNLYGFTKPGAAGSDLPLPLQWSFWNYVDVFLEKWRDGPPETARDCFDIFMTAFFSAYSNLRNSPNEKRLISAFTPRVNFIETYEANTRFFTDYSDGHMISMVRHPADWYASAMRHDEVYADLEIALGLWRESTRSSLLLKDRFFDQVTLIPFDQLILRPAETMKSLANRLDLRWEEALLEPSMNNRPVGSDSSFRSVAGIDPSTTKRRSELPEDIRTRIERENGELYREFLSAIASHGG